MKRALLRKSDFELFSDNSTNLSLECVVAENLNVIVLMTWALRYKKNKRLFILSSLQQVVQIANFNLCPGCLMATLQYFQKWKVCMVLFLCRVVYWIFAFDILEFAVWLSCRCGSFENWWVKFALFYNKCFLCARAKFLKGSWGY